MPGESHIIDDLHRIAEALGQKGIMRELEDCREKQSTSSVYVALVGQFKRGKSTLINAIVGRPVLPVDVLPLTSAITIVEGSSIDRARVEFEDGERKEIGLGELIGFVTEEHNSGNRHGVRLVHVEAVTHSLRPEIRLVDTPGIGSVFKLNSEVTKTFIPQIDVVMLILGSDPPITSDELELAREIRQTGQRFLIVLNKADKASLEDRTKAETFTRRMLVELAGVEGIPIFHTSALRALETGTDQGVSEVADYLNREVAAKTVELLQETTQRTTQRTASMLRQAIELRRAMLALPTVELEDKIRRFREQVADINDLILSAKTRALAAARTEDGCWSDLREEHLRESLLEVQGDLEQLAADRSVDFALEAISHARQISSQAVARWLEKSFHDYGEFEQGYRKTVDNETRRLVQRISEAAASVFGLPGFHYDYRSIEPPRRDSHFEFNEKVLALDTQPLLDAFFRWFVPRAMMIRHFSRRAVSLARDWIDRNMNSVDNQHTHWVEHAKGTLQSQMQDVLREAEDFVISTTRSSTHEAQQSRANVEDEIQFLHSLEASIVATTPAAEESQP